MEFLYGTLQQAPEDFAPPEMWPEYMRLSEPREICSKEEVGQNPKGLRWSLWPFTFEDYLSDTEPDLAASRQGALARNRLITWERVRRSDTPAGWLVFSRRTWRIDGAFWFRPGENYTARWKKNARRDLQLFKKATADGQYRIEPIAWDEFASSYNQSLIAKRLNNNRMLDLEKKLAYPLARANTELWGVRNQASGQIVAGTAILYSPTYKSSTHIAPFILAEGRHICAATGLIDHWFAQTQARGYAYAVTLNFWFKGQPKSWKGFSEFKSHFGFSMIEYPPILLKFVYGKFF